MSAFASEKEFFYSFNVEVRGWSLLALSTARLDSDHMLVEPVFKLDHARGTRKIEAIKVMASTHEHP